MIDLCSLLMTDDLLWVCIVTLWAKILSTGFQQQQQMVLRAVATWGCLQQIIVCWIRHKYLLLSFNCSCPFFIHLQNMAVCQNRHKFLGFCVKSALLLECFFYLFFFLHQASLGETTISVYSVLPSGAFWALFCSWQTGDCRSGVVFMNKTMFFSLHLCLCLWLSRFKHVSYEPEAKFLIPQTALFGLSYTYLFDMSVTVSTRTLHNSFTRLSPLCDLRKSCQECRPCAALMHVVMVSGQVHGDPLPSHEEK